MIQEKYSALKNYISSLKSVAVAFSGGVDSTLLLKVSRDVLGDNAIAITLSSNLFPRKEMDEAKTFCSENHIKQIIFHVDELAINGFADNPPDRCYICKKNLFSQILKLAHENKIAHVIDGSNLDDLGDYRPGMKALSELGIISPLRIAQFTKSDVRDLSHLLGLKTWQKPSFACLASRFVYGEKITPEKLIMVEQAEELLRDLKFTQFRVRIHGNIARIEVLPEDFSRIIDAHKKIYDTLKALGFSYVTLDLKGYRSMNEVLSSERP